MYLRFLHLTIEDAKLRQAQEFYEQNVLPALESSGGCLFASLLQATGRAEHCVSMTLWDSHDRARAWEQSEAYGSLLRRWSELDVDPAEWRFAPPTAAGDATAGEPPAAEGFTLEAGDPSPLRQESASRLFVRIVSIRVREGGWDELVGLYEAEVAPTLLSMPGCRAAFLLEGLEDPDRGLSVSIWDREEDAIRYELSGTFDSITRRLKNILTATRQWQAALTSEGIAEGNPPSEGFRVILGRPL